MPSKYQIHSRQAPSRHKIIGKYGIVDWREDCSACHNCVKRECAYSVYDQERDRLSGALDYVDYLYECKGCLCCVQSCTKGLLTWEINPEYLELGDDVWTPDIISTTWFQAETGKIPVSGAGYSGPFRGPGFDSILTDMSEIVRPTRDGIHGREYISTMVDVGRKPMKLVFNSDGSLETDFAKQVEIPLPVIFNTMPWHKQDSKVQEIFLDAAKALGTFALADDSDLQSHEAAIPCGEDFKTGKAHMAQWQDSPDVISLIQKAKSDNPDLVAIVSLPLGSASIGRALELAKDGIDALHMHADWHGDVFNSSLPENPIELSPEHISIAVREIHQALVKAGLRDQVTLIAGGGISLAEHVVKTVICGADLISIDLPLMIAMECRVCQRCKRELKCPVGFDAIDHDYGVQRITNLMGAWHSQMLEMMGAMGIREIRRLRGEVGRAMFFDDLEKECFGPIFGTRKPAQASKEVS